MQSMSVLEVGRAIKSPFNPLNFLCAGKLSLPTQNYHG